MNQLNSKSKASIKVRIYNPGRGHKDIYNFTLTQKGWFISFMGISGNCRPDGKPILYQNLNHDVIGSHTDLPETLEALWKKAHLENMDNNQLSFALKKVAVWLNRMNLFAPSFVLRKRTIALLKNASRRD